MGLKVPRLPRVSVCSKGRSGTRLSSGDIGMYSRCTRDVAEARQDGAVGLSES